MMIRQRLPWVASLALLVGLLGCNDSSDSDDRTPVDPVFTTYVSLGDSVTEGVMSGDANGFTQSFAYPVILADAFNTNFSVPNMVATASGFFRVNPSEPANNLGVSGMSVVLPTLPVTTTTTTTDPTMFSNELDAILAPAAAGSSVLDVAIARNPTFMTIWLGNNDLLGSVASTVDTDVSVLAMGGYPFPFAAKLDDTDPRGALYPPLDRTAPPAAFELGYGAMISTLLANTGTQIVVANLPDTGDLAYMFNLAEASQFLRNYGGVSLSDLANAGWTTSGFGFGGDPDALVPFDLLLTAMTNIVIPNPDKVTALNTLSVGMPNLALFDFDVNNLDSAEQADLTTRVDALNQAIASVVTPNSSRVGLCDLNTLFSDVVDNGYQLVDTNGLPVTLYRTFPVAEISKSYAGASAQRFDRNGGGFSLDGIHPSPTAHALVAEEFRQAINALIGTNLGAIDVFAVWQNDVFVDHDLDGRVPGFSFTATTPIGNNVIFRDADDFTANDFGF